MITLRDVVARFGGNVHTIPPNATLKCAVIEMARRNVGRLVVAVGRIPFGIITTRDVVRAAATLGDAQKHAAVADFMTTDMLTSRTQDALDHVIELMNRYGAQHVLVKDGDTICATLSHDDVQQAQCDELEFENHCMRSYIEEENGELTPLAP